MEINSKSNKFGDYRCRYNGKEFDESAGLYYYVARFYNPTIGCFLSVDPLADDYPDFSPYVYTANNPVMFIDPTGMAVETDYEINNRGKITKVEGTETTDGKDRLIYGKAKYKKSGELKRSSKYVEVSKGVLDKIRTGDGYQIFEMSSSKEAESVYYFIGNRINAEMGKYDIITGSGKSKSIFHTSYDWDKIKHNSAYLVALKDKDPKMQLVSMIHNHGNNPDPNALTTGANGPSNKNGHGDVPQAEFLNNIFSSQKNKPKYYIFRYGVKTEYDENGKK